MFVHCHDTSSVFPQHQNNFGSIVMHIFISYLSYSHVASVLMLSIYLGVEKSEGVAESRVL